MSASPKQHHETRPEDRIPFLEKFGFAVGTLSAGGVSVTAYGLLNFIYNMTLGLSPALISTVVFIQNVATSILDPLLGQYSDNFRSRWGRRRPLMVLAAVPLVISFAAIYLFPRGLKEHGLFLWLLITLPVASLMISVYNCAFNALTIEATRDYHERIRLGTVVTLTAIAFGLLVQWIFPFIQRPIFTDPIQGLRCVVIVASLFFLCAAFVPVLLCPEKQYAALAGKLSKSALLPNLLEARKNRPFLIILSIKFFAFFCYNIVGALGMYMNTYYIYGGDVKKAAATYGFLGSSYILAAFASLFVYPHIARMWGKKRTLQLAGCVLVVGCLCKLVVYQPKYPWLQLIVLMANGVAVQGMNFIVVTMVGDIVDYDELLFGKRREALYSSLIGWFEKAGSSLGTLLCGFLLVCIGFNAKTGAQGHHTLELMKYFYFLFPFVGAIFSIVAVSRYELTESRAYEIRDALKQRHAASAPSGEDNKEEEAVYKSLTELVDDGTCTG